MKTLRLLTIVGTLSILFGCSRYHFTEGELYSTPMENGGYTVLKILKIDDQGVHVRRYSNRFKERPLSVDESSLYMAGTDRHPGEMMGMGHAPISKKSFNKWNVEFIQNSQVNEDELEGYYMWRKSGGGYF
jgi:hypothetical protein